MGSAMYWMSDPWGARKQIKDDAVRRLRSDLRDAGASDDDVAATVAELRGALADVTTEEYPERWEYEAAVQSALARVAAAWRRA